MLAVVTDVPEEWSLTHKVASLVGLGCFVAGFLPSNTHYLRFAIHSQTGSCVQSSRLFGLWGRGLMTPEMQAK